MKAACWHQQIMSVQSLLAYQVYIANTNNKTFYENQPEILAISPS